MGRLAARLALLCIVLSAACKGDEPAQAAKSLENPEEIAENDDNLIARRDALLAARRDLRKKREALAKRREEIRASGGDTSEVDQQADELLDREKNILKKESALNTEIDSILEKRRAQLLAFAGGADESTKMSVREAQLAAREKAVARRESALADREKELGEREERMAQRWKDSCTVGAPTIVQAPPPKGAKYNRRDVVPLLKRARREMSRKGILPSDLPEQARTLEKEATDAMGKGDYAQAHFAAAQLHSTVRAIAVNKAFIAGKFSRLNRAMRGKRLNGDQEKLLKGATSDYGDGRFRSANQKLNRLYATLH